MTEPRTWTVELPAGLPLINANERLHWAVRSNRTRAIRQAARLITRNAHIPTVGHVRVVVEYRPPDRRRRDAANWAPSAKAAVDGLVDAQVVPDDSTEYLTGPDMRTGPVVPGGQLVLHIAEVVAP